MPLASESLAQLQHDYDVLDLPQTASAQQIKQAYRKLTKRWHPDLYPAGSQQQTEATQMMGIINRSYERIATAPLRFYNSRFTPPAPPRSERTPYVNVVRPQPSDFMRRQRSEPPPKLHLFEFSVRFFFGALFGLMLGLYAVIRSMSHIEDWKMVGFVILGESIVFGVLSGIYGDDFWLGTLRRRWWWW